MSQQIARMVIYIFFLKTHLQNAHAKKTFVRSVQTTASSVEMEEVEV